MLTVNADSARLMVTITVKANDSKSSPELSYQIARNTATHSTPEVIQTKCKQEAQKKQTKNKQLV